MSRAYHYWTDEELWRLFCWYQATRRLGTITSYAFDCGTTPAALGQQLKKARDEIHAIERRLGKSLEDRERAIREVLNR